jgi:hypothetical protein
MDLSELQAEYQRQQREVTDDRIAVGSLIRTILSETDGLTFKDGRKEKPKRLIVIGVDREIALCFGSVLVNTKPSPKADFSEEYLTAQYELKQKDYPEFLKYNSYVDCGELFSIPIERLKQGEFYGFLTDADREGIFNILETSDIFSTKEKKRYGIHRR